MSDQRNEDQDKRWETIKMRQSREEIALLRRIAFLLDYTSIDLLIRRLISSPLSLSGLVVLCDDKEVDSLWQKVQLINSFSRN